MDAIWAWAILDSGATSHFLTTAAPMINMRPISKPIIAWLPNGEHVHSTHTGCDVVFTKIGCTITYHSKVILCGSKCTRTGLWMIPLYPAPPLSANNNQANFLPTVIAANVDATFSAGEYARLS
jgi:hypothetical protein